MGFLPKITARAKQPAADTRNDLIRFEAQIGGELFGAVPKGRNRQFFCLDATTWIWHESWRDTQGVQRSLTTRYEVRPDGVLKIQDGQPYQRLSTSEARNLFHTAALYEQKVTSAYQKLLQTA